MLKFALKEVAFLGPQVEGYGPCLTFKILQELANYASTRPAPPASGGAADIYIYIYIYIQMPATTPPSMP